MEWLWLLWYLNATIYATIIVFVINKLLNLKNAIRISFLLFFIGCLISSWSPLFEKCFLFNFFKSINNIIGHRNGLFYGPAFVSIGLFFATNNRNEYSRKQSCIGFTLSFVMLIIECVVFIMYFKGKQTILFLSMIPATYYLCKIILNTSWNINKNKALLLRKLSTIIYFIHPIYLKLFASLGHGIVYFLIVTFFSIFSGFILIKVSMKIKMLKNIY